MKLEDRTVGGVRTLKNPTSKNTFSDFFITENPKFLHNTQMGILAICGLDL
jgi:hypothetical protein